MRPALETALETTKRESISDKKNKSRSMSINSPF
jgi:hypothetical protein